MKKVIISLVYTIVMLISISFVIAIDVTVNDYDPRPAEAGKAVNVWFKVDNPTNDPEQGVTIEIIPKDGLKLTQGEESKKNIGTLPSKKSEIVQFRLIVDDDAFEGAHVIQALIRKAGETSPLKRDLTIEVTDKDFKDISLSVGDIESDPSRIKPDDNNVKLEVTIQNLGDGRAQGVKAELIDLPKGITLSESYSGTSLLGNIEADSTSLATFFIDVEKTVEAKEHRAYIKATYKFKKDEDEDDYTFEEARIPIRLAVKPIPIYEITEIKLIPEVLTAGDQEVKLTISIKNIGQEEGESVRLKVFGKTEQPFDYETTNDFISPSLKPGEIGQGTLEFDIDDDAPVQKYFLDIEIKNIVNEDVITFDEKIPIEVKYPKPNNPWGFVTIGVILIAIFIIVILVRRRKKKKTTPKAKKVDSSYGKSYLESVKKKK